MSLLAITVIGRDRPGIIAEATAPLGQLGLNLEDSTMTLLRGHFAMVLVCRGEDERADVATVEASLAPLSADGSLAVTVRPVPEGAGTGVVGSTYVLTVHGADRTGIVSAVVARVADAGGNITDLTTRLAGDLYLLVAEVDLPADVDAGALEAALREAAASLGVEATLRPLESDEL